jgi:maleate isomerase
VHVSRVPSGLDVTPDTLQAMADALPAAAGLLPRGADYGAIGYACTSGASVIGSARVATLVRGAARTAHVTDPLSAACAALARLGASRIAVVSPYVASVGAALSQAFAARGVTVATTTSFAVSEEARVARIAAAPIRAAALAAASEAAAVGAGAEAVFLSCTNLRTLDLIAPLEAALGLPVLSSNAARAWDMARLAGAPAPPAAFGRIMAVR